MKSLVTISLLTVFFFLGCTREDSSRNVHAGRVEGNEKSVGGTGSKTPDKNTIIDADAQSFANQFKVRLSLSKLEEEKRKQSTVDSTELYEFLKKASDFTASLARSNDASRMIVQTFKEAVTAGCDLQLRGCRYASGFKGMPGAVDLLLIIANESKNNLPERYRLLALAISLSGAVDDPRLAIEYLATAGPYEKELLAKSDAESRNALKQHREIFESSLIRLRQSLAAGEKLPFELLKGLETAFDVWNFDRPRKLETADRELVFFELVASRFFEDADLRSRLFKETATNGNSTVSVLAKMSGDSLSAFGLNLSIEQNLSWFISENLWLGRMTPAESHVLWQAFLRKQKSGAERFRETTQIELLNYARTRMMFSAKAANKITTDFFASKSNASTARFATGDAFREWMLETVKGKVIWADAVHRFESLRSFNDRELRVPQATDKTNLDLDMFFASIDRNIKLISTYPSMLVSLYHLAKLKFEIKYASIYGQKTYEAGLILDQFFDGYFEPFMAYSEDRARLSKSDITFVFYFALEIGTLSEGGVNITDLFKMLTEQMAGKTRLKAEKLNDDFHLAYEANRDSITFKSICSRLIDSKISNAQKQNMNLISIPLKLESLTRYTMMGRPEFMGSKDFADPVLTAGWGVFIGDGETTKNKFGENLEMIRLDLTARIDQIKNLGSIVIDHLSRHSDPDQQKITAALKKELSPLEQIRKRLYTQIFKLVKENGSCGETITQLELQAQLHVLRGLAAHFREVHGVIKNVRDHGVARDVFDLRFGFAKTTKIPELANYETALGITSEFFRVSRLQLLLRIANILENGYVEDGKVVEGIREKKSIILPARLRDVNSDIRRNSFRVDWNEDVDEFVTNAIIQIFDPEVNFVKWSSLSTMASSIQSRIEGMATLAQAGWVDTDSGPQRVEPKEVIRMSLVMEKWLEISGTDWMNILNVTGEYTRVKTAGILDEFAWETKSRTWMGILDFAFIQMSNDKIGGGITDEFTSSSVFKRTGPKAGYVAYARSMRAFGNPALKIHSNVLKLVEDFYKTKLDSQFDLVAETIREIKKLEPAREANPTVFPAWRLHSLRRVPKVPLLSESRFENFRLETLELNKTVNYVAPKSLQDAFKR